MLRPDVPADTRFIETVKGDPLGSDMVAPLMARGKVIGTLNVGCRAVNALGDTDLEKLVNCANIASGAIEHAILLEEAKDLGRALSHPAAQRQRHHHADRSQQRAAWSK